MPNDRERLQHGAEAIAGALTRECWSRFLRFLVVSLHNLYGWRCAMTDQRREEEEMEELTESSAASRREFLKKAIVATGFGVPVVQTFLVRELNAEKPEDDEEDADDDADAEDDDAEDDEDDDAEDDDAEDDDAEDDEDDDAEDDDDDEE